MKIYFIIILAAIIVASSVHAQQEKQVVDLRGNWKFEIGNQHTYSDPKFDDSKWTEIFVPSDWENEGFAGYDGYAWYRKNFFLSKPVRGTAYYIHIIVDDVCGIYINGNLIGEGGQFPPNFETAYNVEHKFFIPSAFLRYDQQNTVAVRVYDNHLNGGIVKGRVGVYEHKDEMNFVIRLPEMWKFKKGDNEQWSDPKIDDSKWQELIVPAAWDFQGYKDYDGFGWYRTSFDVPSDLKEEDLVLVLGRIDDIDETYLNGELIGNTGRIRSDGSTGMIRDEYQEIRGYTIPSSLLRKGEKNVVAVRVFDNFRYGGIYDGPIGIVRERDYKQWDSKFKKHSESKSSRFQRLMEKIFQD